MKWFAGLGKQLAGVFSSGEDTAASRRQRERVLNHSLHRLTGKAPDKELLQDILAGQKNVEEIGKRLREGKPDAVSLELAGTEHLQPYRTARQGYILVYVQGFLTAPLRHLAAGPPLAAPAQVVFQPHEDPSAHLTVLERGHGLAFKLAFFPLDEDDALMLPFLQALTAVSRKVARFALSTGAPILPLWGRPTGPQSLVIEIGPAWEKGAATEDTVLTHALVDHFAQQILRAPQEVDWDDTCWLPPTHRLLPSRFPWHLDALSKRDLQKVQPLRLLVRVPDSVREACLAIPAVRALKRGRPDVHLTVLTQAPMHAFWNLLDACDACQEPASASSGNAAPLPYDLGIALSSAREAVAELAAFRPLRVVGMETHPQAGDFDEALKMPRKLGPPEHRHRTYLRVAHRLGAEVVHDPHLRGPVAPVKPNLSKASQGKKRKNAPPSKGVVIGVAPGSDDGPSYCWPTERFQEVIRRSASLKGTLSWRVILPPESDRESWENLLEELGKQRLKIVADSEDIGDRLESLKGCHLVLANDNDLLHLAATIQGLPTLALYGPSEPIETAPVIGNALTLRRHVECTPCHLSECPLDHRCLQEISVDEVLEALQVCLEAARARNTPKVH